MVMTTLLEQLCLGTASPERSQDGRRAAYNVPGTYQGIKNDSACWKSAKDLEHERACSREKERLDAT